jgi:hypothetical protein
MELCPGRDLKGETACSDNLHHACAQREASGEEEPDSESRKRRDRHRSDESEYWGRGRWPTAATRG